MARRKQKTACGNWTHLDLAEDQTARVLYWTQAERFVQVPMLCCLCSPGCLPAPTAIHNPACWGERPREVTGTSLPARSSIANHDGRRVPRHRAAKRVHDFRWRVRALVPLLTSATDFAYRPKSEEKLTTSEQLQLDSEMDGTAFAEEREEEKRQKDENWARYTDTHPRGAGNTMNRG